MCWLLDRPAEVQEVFLNKRMDYRDGLVIAVHTAEASYQDFSTPQTYLQLPISTSDAPPHMLQNPSSSVFRDEIVLENGLVVYVQVSRKRSICKGFRNAANAIGLWNCGGRGNQEIPLDSLDEWRLVNIDEGGKRSVRLVQRVPTCCSEKEIRLQVGLVLVWWTGGEENVAEIHNH
jgi:hypothetical protein